MAELKIQSLDSLVATAQKPTTRPAEQRLFENSVASAGL